MTTTAVPRTPVVVEPPREPIRDPKESAPRWPRYDLEEPEDTAWICRGID